MELIQDNRMQAKKEIMDFLTKWGALGAYILIGWVGKMGFDVVNGKRLNFAYVFGSGCIAICIGWLAWEWCQRAPSLNPGLIVPIATLISRDIMLFITMIDWVGVLKLVTRKGTKKIRTDE